MNLNHFTEIRPRIISRVFYSKAFLNPANFTVAEFREVFDGVGADGVGVKLPIFQ